ncbi:unnamed protein product [Candida verbasci]|uniref:STI1 domain-containing protein n=1 Tax=Candida verbasci TaxID=1227364 RepID=A0A9W4TYF7_9ASCO|nr:unnamed protein product [Candida verbasci]
MTTAEEFKAEGNKYFIEKNFEKAIESFTNAINASTEPNYVLYSNRSGAYASLKNFKQAYDDAKECVNLNPNWPKGYNRLAGAEFGLGNLENAKQTYEKCLSLDSNNQQAKDGLKSVENALKARNTQNDLGLGAMFQDPNLISNLRNNPKTAELMKDPELVGKILNIQQNPKANATQLLTDPRLMTIMATLMGIDMDFPEENKNNTEPKQEAEQEVKEEIKEDPKEEIKEDSKEEIKDEIDNEDVEMTDASSKDTADAFKAKGNTLYKQRKFDEAIEQYDKAWNTFKDITYLNNKAAAEYEKGDYDAAIKTCELAVDEGRDMRADYKLIAKSFARLGNVYLKKQDLESAAKYFDKSLTEHRTPDVLNKLRSTQREIKIKEANAYIDPEQAEEARLQGKDFFTKGDWPNAVRAYGEMIKRAPEDARGYSNRAAALAKLLSFPDAVQDCNKAIELDPQFIRAYIRKANCQLAMKEYSHCMETLSDARKVDVQYNQSKSIKEIDDLLNKATYQRFQALEGETPEQTMERVSKDPEIVSILQDPVMQGILSQARENPAALQDHMKNPDVAKKVNMLVAAGVIRTR